MTAYDPFERRLSRALEDLASPQLPDYFDDALARAVSRRQRPAWAFPERWIPMSTIARGRSVLIPGVPLRTVAVLLMILALLVASAVISIGLREDRDPAPPFGPASNGLVAYLADGQIFARDFETGERTLLVGGPSDDVFPQFSLDGLSLAFVRLEPDEDDGGTLMVANADGSDVRPLLGPAMLEGISWSPRSDELAVIYTDADRGRVLALVPIDGSDTRILDLPVAPADQVVWRPPDGRELIFQAIDGELRAIFGVQADGTDLRRLTERSSRGAFDGPYEITPDGSKLFFTRVDPDITVSLRVLDLDTGETRRFGEQMPPPEPWDGQRQHTASGSISPDGKSVVFARYWNEAAGMINSQLWIASIDGDGSDAIPITPIHNTTTGHGPFYQTFAPDGSGVLIHTIDDSVTWIADPEDGSIEELAWGEVQDPPSWQRVAP